MTKKKKICFTAIILFAIVVVIISTMAGLYFASDPYRGTIKIVEKSKDINDTLTYQEAKSDLAYIFDKIKDRHYSAKKHLPQNFADAYNKEVAQLKDVNTVAEFHAAAKRLVSTLSDAHSDIRYISSQTFQHGQTFLVDNNGNIYIIFDGVKYLVTQINGINVSDVLAMAKNGISHENEFWLYESLQTLLQTAEGISSIGMPLITDKITVAYEKNGGEIIASYDYLKADAAIPPALESISYSFDEENSLGIIVINTMRYDNAYKTELKNFFTEVNSKKIKNIAVDLANNGGGNSACVNEFLKYIKTEKYKAFGTNVRYGAFSQTHKPKEVINHYDKTLAFSGKVYAITSRKTFSSAMMFATLFYDNNLAEIVGESLGNSPNTYGEVLKFQLPNSKLVLTTTFKYFTRPDSDNQENTVTPHHVSNKPIEKIKSLIKGA